MLEKIQSFPYWFIFLNPLFRFNPHPFPKTRNHPFPKILYIISITNSKKPAYYENCCPSWSYLYCSSQSQFRSSMEYIHHVGCYVFINMIFIIKIIFDNIHIFEYNNSSCSTMKYVKIQWNKEKYKRAEVGIKIMTLWETIDTAINTLRSKREICPRLLLHLLLHIIHRAHRSCS